MRARCAIGLLAVLGACGKAEDKAASAGSGSLSADAPDVPEVDGGGYGPTSGVVAITASPTAIFVHGKQVVAIDNGTVAGKPPRDTMIPALADALRGNKVTGAVLVGLDKRLPYRLLAEIVTTAKSTGIRNFGLVAKTGTARVAVPIDLPELKMSATSTDVRGPSVASAGTDPDKPTAKIQLVEGKVVQETSLSAQAVVSKVQSTYIAGIKRCLLSTITSIPRAKDTAELSFTINQSGLATDASVSGVNSESTGCLAQAISTWRFPIPKDADLQPTTMSASFVLDVTYEAPAPKPVAEAPAPAVAPVMPTVPPPDAKLQLVLAVTKTDAIVWSLSGLEGTLAAPRARIPLGPTAAAEIRKQLHDIVNRRWGGGATRAPADQEIIFMADATLPMQTVAELLGAVRAQGDVPLFPSVLLSLGFE